MITCKKFPLLTLFALLAATQTTAQVVEEVTVIKSSDWVQTSAAAPIIDPSPIGPNYGGPYAFNVEVSGTNLGGITAPVVTLPAGSLYPTQNPVRHNNGTLTYDANDGRWAYGSDANQWGGPTANARDTAFAPGIYGLSVNGTSFNLNFPTTNFPENTPMVTLTGGTWVRGVYMIDVTQALTITTNAFTNFNQNADGVMTLNIDDATEQFVFYSDNHAADNFLTQTIPANTLVAGTEYSGEAGFYAITERSTAIPGSLNVAAYGRNTRFRIVAYSGTLPSATLHAIGDLPGGIASSEVRDVTRINNVLYAVGSASANSNVPSGRDTAVIWTTTGGLKPLPNLVNNTAANNFVTASAITPDAAYIASRARSVFPGGAFQAVRVTTNGMTNLSFSGLAGGTNNSSATSISNDGSILYGLANNNTQAVRYTSSGPTGALIPFLNPGDNQSAPAARGCSSNGLIMVGTSINSGTAHRGAFRYVQGAGVTAIPYLGGGTWNSALAVSPNGLLTLVFGDSPSAPQGEFYLRNLTPGSAAITPLGTPNGGRGSNGQGGMTADGSVVVGNLNDLTTVNGVTTGGSASYMHNSHGWHNLQDVAAAAGVDLTGWTLDPVEGMSSDGTLVWGLGTHNGHPEGFVLEFAPGYLASFTEPTPYSTPNAAIVGAWTIGNTAQPHDWAVLVFFADGYYMHFEREDVGETGGADGFERGQYTWNPITGQLTTHTLLDTNGEIGLSGNEGETDLTVTISGDTATANTDDGPITLNRVVATSPIMGAFGAANLGDDSAAVVFLPNGYYVMAQDGDSTPAGDPNGHDGMEWGTYTWNSGTGAFTATPLVDTNGQWGLSHPQAPYNITPSGDLLTLTLTEGADVFPISRVGAIAAPAITLHPASQAVLVGGGVTFNATASGTPTPTYQWRKDGVNIGGATGPSYTIASTSLGDAGSYTFVATNIAGSATSNAAVLAVNMAPAITTQPIGHFVTVGANVTLFITATGFPAPTYQWKKDNVDIPGATSASYTINNAQLGDGAVYTVAATNLVSTATSNATTLTVTVASLTPVPADFNNDGKPDIVWRNTATGAIAFWFMNGTAQQSALGIGAVTMDWSIAGTGDFNNDGQTDLLWRKASTGGVAVWLMNGTAMQSAPLLANITADWRIDGTGDFNGDGKVDILWRKESTGAVALWLMDGLVIQSTPIIANITADWLIGGTGDFNGDNKVDIVWRKESTGAVAFWLMNGVAISSTPVVANITADWKIAGTGDYNADGETDILWRKESTGLVAFWLMNDTAIQSTPVSATITANWVICN